MKNNCIILNSSSETELKKYLKQYNFVFLLTSFNQNYPRVISIPNYIEKNRTILKKTYLEIVQKIKFNFMNYNNLKFGNKTNFFNFSVIEERNPFKSNTIQNCLLFISLSTLIKKYKIKQLNYDADNELIEHIIRKNQKYLNLEDLKFNYNTKKDISNYFYLVFKNIIYAIYEIFFNIKLIFFLRKDEKIFDNKIKNCIFTQFAHLDLKNDHIPSYWSNFKYLLNFKKILWCFMYVKSDQFKTIEDLKIYLSKTKYKNIIFLHSLGSLSLIVKSIFIYLQILINFLLIKKKNKFKFKNYNLYYLFESDLIESFIGVSSIKNIFNFLLINQFHKKFKLEKIFYLFENQPHEKYLNYMFKKKTKCIGFAHSSIRFWHLSYYNFNKLKKNEIYEPHFICLSKNKFNYTQDMNFNSKLIDIEPIRFINSKKTLNNKFIKKGKILIIGDILKENTERMFKLIDKLPLYKRKNFYFKRHTASDNDLIINKKYKNFNNDIQNSLVLFDTFICGSSTTAGIIPYKSNKKILFFKDPYTLNLNPINKLENYYKFTSSFELYDKIKINKYKKKSNNSNIKFKKWKKFIKYLNITY